MQLVVKYFFNEQLKSLSLIKILQREREAKRHFLNLQVSRGWFAPAGREAVGT